MLLVLSLKLPDSSKGAQQPVLHHGRLTSYQKLFWTCKTAEGHVQTLQTVPGVDYVNHATAYPAKIKVPDALLPLELHCF